jgi:hypothetical protein
MNDHIPADPVAEVMKNGLVELPFSDFDHRVMVKIRREAETVARSKKDKRFSSLFFMLGCFSGMCLSGMVGLGERPGEPVWWKMITIVLFLLFLDSACQQVFKTRLASKLFTTNSQHRKRVGR